MKRVQELAKENSKLIWQLFTKNKPVKKRNQRKITEKEASKDESHVKQPTDECLYSPQAEQINEPTTTS